jgi:general secretion pathway protein D
VKVLSIDLMDSLDSSLSYGFEVGDFRGGFRSGDIGNPIEAGVFEVVGGNFQARLQLLQQENRVTELLSPLLLTAHEEVSRIFVGETVPIVTDFTPGSVVAGEGDPIVVPPIPNTELQDIGTELLITPRINADRTVTLRLLQQSSVRQEGAATIPVPITDGGGTAIVDQPIDTVQRQTVTTTLVAKDGETVAVAGLIREGQTDNKAQIPLLGDIPLLGVLFRSQRTARTRDEVVVLIRPFVLNTPSDAVSRGRQLLREMSLHPMAQDPEGTLRTFGPREVPDRGIGRKLHARFRFLGYEQPNDAGTEGKR